MAALFLDSGIVGAQAFVRRTLIPKMSVEMAREPENPKSALQEKLQEEGITPTYKLVETQGPPHDRTFVAGFCRHESARKRHRSHEEGREPGGSNGLDALGFTKVSKADKAKAKREKKQSRTEKKNKG